LRKVYPSNLIHHDKDKAAGSSREAGMGSNSGKELLLSKEEKFALYLLPEKKAELLP